MSGRGTRKHKKNSSDVNSTLHTKPSHKSKVTEPNQPVQTDEFPVKPADKEDENKASTSGSTAIDPNKLNLPDRNNTEGTTVAATTQTSTVTFTMATDQEENPACFKVMPHYDSTFTKHYHLTTAREIRMIDEQTELKSRVIDDNSSGPEQYIDKPKVIAGVLLSFILPKGSGDVVTFSYSQKRNGYAKKSKSTTTFKRMYSFGDMNCPMSTTYTVIERNNADHALYWMHDAQKTAVSIGAKIVLLHPKYVGVMKTGAPLIETSRPFQMIQKPSISPKAYSPHTVTGETKYFVLKGATVLRKTFSSPVAFNTQCNSDACDRITSVKNPNGPCGCFSTFQRTGRNARNVCLKFDFVFRGHQEQLVPIDNFTSLRTSRLFFENEIISNDIEQMQCSAVASLVTEAWHKVIKHVNKKGGWTIIGWYVRATKQQDEAAEENDAEKSYYETIRTNVVYLYPTVLKHSDIPDDLLVKQEAVAKALATASNTQEDIRDMNKDNV